MNIKQKQNKKVLITTIIQVFLLMLLFQELKDCPCFNNITDDAKKVERNSHTKYFLPRIKVTDYNVLVDGTNFYDQPINDQIKKYNEIRKNATRQGDDYITGCLLDYQYFKDHYQLIAVDLTKKNWILIQEQFRKLSFMECSKLTRKWYYSFRKIKRNDARILQRNSKSVVTTYKSLNTVK